MTYFDEAKRESLTKQVIGFSLASLATISTVISLLKMIYYHLDNGTQIGSFIAYPFKRLVYLIYENTAILSFFWENSPTPNQIKLSETHNFYFLGIYLLIFIGLTFLASGRKLSIRLNQLNQEIEDQVIKESIRGSLARSKEQIKDSIGKIKTTSIFKIFHDSYFAPFVVGVFLLIISKWLGS